MSGGQVGGLDLGDADFLEDSGQIGRQLLGFLAGFAQGEVDDGELGLGFKGDGGAGAHLLGAGGGIGDDGPIFGVRHQAFGAEDFGVLGQFGHVGGCGQKQIEVKFVIVEGGDGLVGEDFDADGLAGRKGDLDLATETGFESVEVEINAFFLAGQRQKLLKGRLGGVRKVTVDFFGEDFVVFGTAIDLAGIFVEVGVGFF